MKLVLEPKEIEQILLDKVNKDFATNFNKVTFGGYYTPQAATFETAEPEQGCEVPE